MSGERAPGALAAAFRPDPDRPARYALVYLSAFCLVFWTLVAATALLSPVLSYYDYQEYISMAQGRLSEVQQPYAGRVLPPLAARLLAAATGLSPAWALGWVSAAGWVVAPVIGGGLLLRRKLPLAWALVIASAPFPALSARFFQVPDAWSVCVILALFSAIDASSRLGSGAAAFILAFVRTSFVLAITLRFLAAGRRRAWRLAPVIALALVLGLALKAPLIAGNQGNQHQMSGLVYILGKTPVNAASNLFGVQVYTNTMAHCPRPAHTLAIGRIPGLGNIRTVGLCPVQPGQVFVSLACYLFAFGVLPVLALRRVWRERPPSLAASDPRWRDMAVFLVAFLACPTFGMTIPRLFVEAYPLLFVAASSIVAGRPLKPGAALGLIAYNLIGVVLIIHLAPA